METISTVLAFTVFLADVKGAPTFNEVEQFQISKINDEERFRGQDDFSFNTYKSQIELEILAFEAQYKTTSSISPPEVNDPQDSLKEYVDSLKQTCRKWGHLGTNAQAVLVRTVLAGSFWKMFAQI